MELPSALPSLTYLRNLLTRDHHSQAYHDNFQSYGTHSYLQPVSLYSSPETSFPYIKLFQNSSQNVITNLDNRSK
jgi:hypothetical protein